jgi:hypothetical protein
MTVGKKFILTDDFKKNVFTVPEGYFETQQIRLIDRVLDAEPQEEVSWAQALRPQLAFAATFVALVMAGYGGVFLLNEFDKPNDVATPMSLDDFYASAIGGMNSLDEQAVLHVFDDDKIDHSINTEDIIDYLASTHVSLADIASLE